MNGDLNPNFKIDNLNAQDIPNKTEASTRS